MLIRRKLKGPKKKKCSRVITDLAILAWHGHPIHVKLGQPSSACCEEEEEEDLFFRPIDLPASPKTLWNL
jgi:hypothetical protein